MNTAVPLTIATALVLLSAARAHGGQYRGPGTVMPSAPTTSTGSSSGASSTGPSTPGPSSGGSSSGGSSSGARASGPAPSAGAAAPTASSVRGAPVGDDLTRWQYWWEWNKDPYLRLKEAVQASITVRGSDEHLMGGGRRNVGRDTLRPTAKDVTDKIVPALKQALSQSPQRDVASSCIIGLAKAGRSYPDLVVLPQITPHLRSLDQEIRETAALALGIARAPEAAPMLIGLLRNDAVGHQLCDRADIDERTRSFAAYGLGLLGRYAEVGLRRTILGPLLAVVRDDETSRDLRVASINAVRLLGSGPEDGPGARALREVAVHSLWTYYRSEERPGHQVLRAHALPAIAVLLRQGGDEKGKYKDLIADELLAARHHDAAVTQAAALALSIMCQPQERRASDKRYTEVLRRAFSDSLDHQTRFFCLMALGEIGGASNRAWLLRTLRTGTKALVKPWAGSALGRMAFAMRDVPGTERVRAEIGSALLREFRAVRNVETRAALAVAMGMCGYREAVDDLRAVLADEQHRDELAGYVCVGLALMGAREASGQIRGIVITSVRRPELLRQSAIALGKLGDKEASELLIGMLASGSQSLAKLSAIAVALAQIGDRRSIDPLCELLRDDGVPDLSRAFAAVALGGVADAEPLPWGADLAVGVNYRAAVGTLTDGIAGVLDIL